MERHRGRPSLEQACLDSRKTYAWLDSVARIKSIISYIVRVSKLAHLRITYASRKVRGMKNCILILMISASTLLTACGQELPYSPDFAPAPGSVVSDALPPSNEACDAIANRSEKMVVIGLWDSSFLLVENDRAYRYGSVSRQIKAYGNAEVAITNVYNTFCTVVVRDGYVAEIY